MQRNSGGIIVYTEPTSDFGKDNKRSRIFLLKGNSIYFTIIQDKLKLNTPVLTAHLFLRYDLKKMFAKASILSADELNLKISNTSTE